MNFEELGKLLSFHKLPTAGLEDCDSVSAEQQEEWEALEQLKQSILHARETTRCNGLEYLVRLQWPLLLNGFPFEPRPANSIADDYIIRDTKHPSRRYVVYRTLPKGGRDSPCGRMEHSLVRCRGEVYMFGGLVYGNFGTSSSDELFQFVADKNRFVAVRPSVQEYEGLPNRPCARVLHTMVCYRGKIYLYGGLTSTPKPQSLSDLWEFDPTSTTWKCLKSQGGPAGGRCSHTAIVYKSSIFVYGGMSIENDGEIIEYSELWEYNFLMNDWSEIVTPESDSLTPCVTHLAALWDHEMYILNSNHRRAIMYKFRFETRTWLPVSFGGKPPFSTVRMAGVVMHSRWLVIGATVKQGSPYRERLPRRHKQHLTKPDIQTVLANGGIYEFNFLLRHWRTIDVLGPPPLAYHAAVTAELRTHKFSGHDDVSEKVLVVGGVTRESEGDSSLLPKAVYPVISKTCYVIDSEELVDGRYGAERMSSSFHWSPSETPPVDFHAANASANLSRHLPTQQVIDRQQS